MKVKENILIEKSIDFAARIIKLQRYLVKDKKETIISKQIVRSGTSIGANINEANYGQSKADFISKLHISLKESPKQKNKSEVSPADVRISLCFICYILLAFKITSSNTATAISSAVFIA